MKTIGAIGDVHAENELLAKAIEFLRSHNVEYILCVGDIADGLGDVEKCCEILQQEGVSVVLGNHDRWLLTGEMRDLKKATQPNSLSTRSRSFLSSLPVTREFLTASGLLLLCHGLGQNDMARLTPDDYGYAIEANLDLQNLLLEQKYQYVINGHTHYRMVRSFGDLFVINAGTLNKNQDPGFLQVDFVHKFVQFYNLTSNYGIEEAEKVSLKAIGF